MAVTVLNVNVEEYYMATPAGRGWVRVLDSSGITADYVNMCLDNWLSRIFNTSLYGFWASSNIYQLLSPAQSSWYHSGIVVRPLSIDNVVACVPTPLGRHADVSSAVSLFVHDLHIKDVATNIPPKVRLRRKSKW